MCMLTYANENYEYPNIRFEKGTCFLSLSAVFAAFAKLSDAEQELVISFCGYIPFSQSQNFSRSTPVHYFDVVLEWQVI